MRGDFRRVSEPRIFHRRSMDARKQPSGQRRNAMVKRIANLLLNSTQDCSCGRSLTGSSEALTILETCEESRIGRTKIYEAINGGQLVARKMGRKTLILRSDLHRFLSELPIATDSDVRRSGFARKHQSSS
jgi:excisionase family DNA binding protein